MAGLPTAIKIHILQGLACFDTPEQVVASVKEEFGIVVSRQCVQAHNPERAAGARLAPQWRAIFHETRQRYMAELDNIGIAWPALRLRRLQRMVEQAEAMGNLPLAVQILEQAAREAGRLAPVQPPADTRR